MFNITKTPTFTVPVPIVLEGIDEPMSLRATFRAISDDEAIGADQKSLDGFKDFLRRVTVRLHDLVDDEGKPVEFTPALFDELISHSHIRMALQRAFWSAMLKARVGN